MTGGDELLTTDELATYLKVSTQTPIMWRHEGVGPRFVRAGSRTIRYRLRDVDAWIDESTRAGEKVGL